LGLGVWARDVVATGGKINIINEKIDSLSSTNFKLLSPIKLNSITNYDFFKSIVSATGGHCDYSPRVPKNLATPLDLIKYLITIKDWYHKTRNFIHCGTGS
jgi:hypothetical protein